MRDTAQQSEAVLAALYRGAPIGLGFLDRDLRFVRVNEELARINDRSPEDHVGRTIGEVVPLLAELLSALVSEVLETGRPVIAFEHSAGTPNDPDAARHWRASYYPVVAADGERLGVGVVVEEITARRRAEQLAELQYAVTRILAEASSFDEAGPRLLESICGVLGWTVAAYWSVDPDGPRFTWARADAGVDGFRAVTERAVLSPALLPGRVAASGRTEWLADLEPERFPRAPVALAEGLRSGVAFPVVVDGEVAGVVELYLSARRVFDHELVPTLEAIGAQLGQFVKRMRAEDERTQLLVREQQARAEAEAAAATLRKLERVADAALQHGPLQDLLNTLLARIVEVLEADTAAILLREDDDRLHLRATVGLETVRDRAIAIPIGEGMAGGVAASRAPLLVPDLSKVSLVSPVLRERGINSVVAIPLIVADQVIGVVHAGSEAFAQFVEDDARLLELIADRIALAINQAALHDAERVAQERLHFLGEASALLAASFDVEETLRTVAKLAVPHFADWCGVELVQPDGEVEQVAVHGELGDAEPGDAVVLPLVVRERTLGRLSFAFGPSGRVYDRGDLSFLQELAARAGVAVDNARLYRDAEERAQATRVLASVGDGVFLVDRTGIVRTWNRAAAAATGLPVDEVVDRRATDAIPGWAAIAPRIAVAPASAAAPRAESLPLDLGTRELWLSIHGVAVPDGVVYAFRDLTEERALEQLRAEFVSTVSHELRTPLAAIYGAAMTLRRSDVALDESQRANLLDVVSGEADRLARTVNAILWASRLDTDSLHVAIQNCDPLTLVHDVLQAQEAHLDRRHDLVLDAAEDLPLVVGDPDKVGRVLINLVDNAVKYSPDGGRVTVAVEAAGSNVRFSVTDQGLGIPSAEVRRVFEKFYRLDPNMNRGVGGTGLGLYICRELVRRMDGRIWVESGGLGRGSTFRVELPAASQ